MTLYNDSKMHARAVDIYLMQTCIEKDSKTHPITNYLVNLIYHVIIVKRLGLI